MVTAHVAVVPLRVALVSASSIMGLPAATSSTLASAVQVMTSAAGSAEVTVIVKLKVNLPPKTAAAAAIVSLEAMTAGVGVKRLVLGSKVPGIPRVGA